MAKNSTPEAESDDYVEYDEVEQLTFMMTVKMGACPSDTLYGTLNLLHPSS